MRGGSADGAWLGVNISPSIVRVSPLRAPFQLVIVLLGTLCAPVALVYASNYLRVWGGGLLRVFWIYLPIIKFSRIIYEGE